MGRGRRGNEVVALRYEFALPIEPDADGRRACVRDFCGMSLAKACDWSIHDDGSGGNPHAHVLVFSARPWRSGLHPEDQGREGAVLVSVPCTWAAGTHPRNRLKAAAADGWEKIYNFKDGRRLTMKQAKAEGLGTKDLHE